MQFKDFLNQLSKVGNLSLPGESAQYDMAPLERVKEINELDIEKRNPRWAGVLALFYPSVSGEAMLVLILRKTYKGVHSNQVGFPGGKAEEEDADLEQTAIRETEEEIGVKQHLITVVKQMTKIYIPPSNFWVQPFMGYALERPDFVKEEAEVEAILEVKIADFLSEKSIITQKITTSYATDLTVPAFKLNGFVVWGATAMMLNEMKTLLIKPA
ncbi:MAG: CoA pyrophosphatase [Leeuwenhoekiella sp.]